MAASALAQGRRTDAMETWVNVTQATNTTSATPQIPWAVSSGGIYAAPAPARPQSPLEWLDGEIEKTCAVARSTS